MSTTLAINGGPRIIDPHEARFVWPRITEQAEKAVQDQLHRSISLYNRSDVFERFEQRFAAYHNMPYALLSNSGTNAIFSMFEGVNLQPGDEVVCPTYTFFASVSPLVYTGARPVFCDCREDGNIDPAVVEAAITPRTKAVLVTHMWGIPCEMDLISQICEKHGLYLLEDCSHAHGASFKGQKVGSVGHAAAWSLQGQKIISGGEGGILLSRDPEIHYRALLQGHYNKRCKQEIPDRHDLKKYELTGFGLKFRAHPLAIALADQQFDHLDEWLEQKRAFAKQIHDGLDGYPFLRLPACPDGDPSWYAYVVQYNPEEANGVGIERFVEALEAEGLSEVDRPGSTRPVHNLPLFTAPDRAMPRMYRSAFGSQGPFPMADRFYQRAIKIPVWAFPEDEKVVGAYIAGFQKVGDAILHQPDALHGS